MWDEVIGRIKWNRLRTGADIGVVVVVVWDVSVSVS
jgi:hypothetical protein